MPPDLVTAEEIGALRARYEKRLARERRARQEAEELLEAKSRELYGINQQLKTLAAELEQRVLDRTRDLALAERRALSLAERDHLTGIANRNVFVRMCAQAIVRAKATGTCFALLLIDLDNFKHVNDGFGHDLGDRVLCEVADRIGGATRAPDHVARLGGDEFAALIADCAGADELGAIAARIIEKVRKPIGHRGHVVEVSCSIGIAIFPDHAVDGAELQRFADLALYKAKAAGRATFSVFDDALRRQNDDHHVLGSDLKRAIEEGEIVPWFQPIVDAQTSQLVGIEALARWRHATRGLLGPAAFLALAEERGLMNDLFSCMLQETCRLTKSWIEAKVIRNVAINVSPTQFRSGRLAGSINAILEKERFPASALIVEITEDVLLSDLDRVGRQIEELARPGIRIALDDFGVGYSNIGYLRRLPIHQLKLDRILTANIGEDPKVRTILGAIIDIARTLGLKVVAEGVEDASQAQWLSHIGCDKLQGYHFGPPTEFGRLREAWQSDRCCRLMS